MSGSQQCSSNLLKSDVIRNMITTNKCQDHKPDEHVDASQHEYVARLVHQIQVTTVQNGLKKAKTKLINC